MNVRGSSWTRRESRKFSFSAVCPHDISRPSYLSTEQRLNYLVDIDPEGRLRWARNHQLVDTTAGRWKDSENGNGIIPDEVSIRQALVQGSSLESTSSRDSEALDTAATHYTGTQQGKYKLTREFRSASLYAGLSIVCFAKQSNAIPGYMFL
ncbi:hypothetical protein B0H12DRAFT_231563 [Mycena haematopus]|nr:hypothetical protein B0H12DRAFT_797498 [Mycena haematopus]KAJ7264554.1 hypothetical protein B0H12DRAFT_231563 [Mycena haematopus]